MRWARLHFGDGGTLDCAEPMGDWAADEFEREWRAVHVHVEWMLSPRGRLDHLLKRFAAADVDNSGE